MDSPWYSMKWITVGTIDATAAAADSALGATERTFQSLFPSNVGIDNALYWYIPMQLSSVEVRFQLGTNNHDVDIDMWKGWVNKNPAQDVSLDCDLKRLATLDVICGQQASLDSLYFADTINVSNDGAYGGIARSGNAGDDAYTADHMATIMFDLNEANLLVFHGYGTFDSDCRVDVRGYA